MQVWPVEASPSRFGDVCLFVPHDLGLRWLCNVDVAHVPTFPAFATFPTFPRFPRIHCLLRGCHTAGPTMTLKRPEKPKNRNLAALHTSVGFCLGREAATGTCKTTTTKAELPATAINSKRAEHRTSREQKESTASRGIQRQQERKPRACKIAKSC